MKTKIFLLLMLSIFFSCSKSDDKRERNPYLTDPVVNLNLNLNLPEYNPLKFPGNYVVTGQGIKGIVVYCVTENQYLAFDLADPNHAPSNCSRMELTGVIASCPCATDENEYFITSGQHTTEPDAKYPMQQYNAQKNGNTIVISN
ncbi:MULTISPECIES: hypothetical protein [Aequorivita]|uniref:Rieske domain-containing protein n=2 Tax=Aequorivita TaxID=153265 RepID=A0AB35YVL0_9FLAO|nr:hypothetical protein [Aequorivita sp. Ant34-E75]WGF93250.1 hypothetical protein QCQ61_03455 [Aequorivita sp. Ant34-E75]